MKYLILALPILLGSCTEDWSCLEQGRSLLSISSSGQLGSADKGCTCDEMRTFELRTFGSVDEDALREDFGCR